MGMHNILDGFFASETVQVSSVRTYLVIQGSNPVRYAYLLLLCKLMLNKCTFLPKYLEHNRHSYYICTQIQTTSNYTTMTLNDFLSKLSSKAKRDLARADMKAAYDDCKQGYYDKYYRYNRNDNGLAYDIAWTLANQTYQNVKVIFLNEDILFDV